jgi:hypothetical protein
MKSKHLFAFIALLAVATAASAQTLTADASTLIPLDAQNFILGWLLGLAKTHPWVATVITILGGARLWVKPVFSFVHWVIDLTPSASDNAVFDRVLAWFHSPLGSKVAYLLDWAFSIKIIPPAAPARVIAPPVV